MGAALEVLADHEQARDPLAHCCPELFGGAGPNVAGGEHARHGGFELPIGHDKAPLVKLDRLEEVKKRLAELAGAGEMDLAEYREARAANERKVQSLRETVAKSAEIEALQRTRAEAVDLQAKWDDLDVEDRRRVVRALAERIEVGPAVKGRNFYSPDRVKVTYR